MQKVAHRDLRNHSAEILRRVERGESFEVTNNGRPAALLVPVTDSPLERQLLSRLVREPTAKRLPAIARVRSARSVADLLDELREQE